MDNSENIQAGAQYLDEVKFDLFRTLSWKSRSFKLWLAALFLIILIGIFAYYRQVRFGLIVTAMRDFTSWGIYISNFVFFVAVSLIGSLVSSILKLSNAKWSTPLTRIAEIIAVASIVCASIIIIVDMGRPDRFFNVILHGRIQSPIIWDVIVIFTYLIISLLLLYLPLIPDIALCRDHLTSAPGWRKKVYRILAAGWKSKPGQYSIILKSIRILGIMIIPVAFAIHTITSWLFATTWRPGWDSTNLGPYFVSGAFMVGSGVIVVAMFFIRKSLGLEKYITEKHFDHMGKLLVLLSLVYLYFNINEYLGPAFKWLGLKGSTLRNYFSGNMLQCTGWYRYLV